MRSFLNILIFSVFSSGLLAQVGGSYTYVFLDMPATARITAMGGNLITFKDNDAGLAADNPALLNQSMDKTAVLSYMSYFAGIKNSFASYTFNNKLGTFSSSLKYLDYGSFRGADAGNNETGTFTASEAALILGYGRAFDSSFSAGINTKFIYSNLYLNNSVGLTFDLSAAYEIKEALFLITMVVKNMGMELKPYQSGVQEPLPFDVQVGISKGFKNMPFKFSLIAHQLAKGKLTYPAQNQSTGSAFGNESEDNSESNFENVLRHFIIAAEMFPGRNFNLRFGYNFQRRKEMQFTDRPATVGLSWGFGLKISKLHFSYARSAYHLAGSPNQFTVLTRFSDWGKK